MHLAITVPHPTTGKMVTVDLYDVSRSMYDNYRAFRVIGKNLFVKATSVEAMLLKTLKAMPKTTPVSEAIAKLGKVKTGLVPATSQQVQQYTKLRDSLRARAVKKLDQQIRWAEKRKQREIAQARATLKRHGVQ